MGDLLVLEMWGYDVILDMNFSSTYHAIIDYFRRRVKLHILEG